MLLQPQALPQHFLHGVADRVAVAAGDRLDLGPRRCAGAPPGASAASSSSADRALPCAAAPAPAQQQDQGDGHGDGGQQQRRSGSRRRSPARSRPQSAVSPAAAANSPPTGLGHCGLTAAGPILNIPRLMSANVPEIAGCLAHGRGAARVRRAPAVVVDAAPARAACSTPRAKCAFALEFDSDALQVPYVELRIDAELPLECQRSLQRFLFPVQMVQRLGLIRDEADEAALPAGLRGAAGCRGRHAAAGGLVEDELILAVPVVPVKPESDAVERDWPMQRKRNCAGQSVRGAGGAEEKLIDCDPIKTPAVASRHISTTQHSDRVGAIPWQCRNPAFPRPAVAMRRSHDALTAKQLATDPTSGRDPPAPPRHRRRLLPRQEGHRDRRPTVVRRRLIRCARRSRWLCTIAAAVAPALRGVQQLERA